MSDLIKGRYPTHLSDLTKARYPTLFALLAMDGPEDDLDAVVLERKATEAHEINQRGFLAQVEYLTGEGLDEEDLVYRVRQHRKIPHDTLLICHDGNSHTVVARVYHKEPFSLAKIDEWLRRFARQTGFSTGQVLFPNEDDVGTVILPSAVQHIVLDEEDEA